MLTYRVETRNSVYEVYHDAGEWYFTALQATGYGALFIGRRFHIVEIRVPREAHDLWVYAHPYETAWPEEHRQLHTSTVQKVTLVSSDTPDLI